MKTRHCRLTPEEKAIHKKAVSLRNLNDKELVQLMEKHQPTMEEMMRERIFAVASFIENLNGIPGIGGATLEKIKKFAEDNGYLGI